MPCRSDTAKGYHLLLSTKLAFLKYTISTQIKFNQDNPTLHKNNLDIILQYAIITHNA